MEFLFSNTPSSPHSTLGRKRRVSGGLHGMSFDSQERGPQLSISPHSSPSRGKTRNGSTPTRFTFEEGNTGVRNPGGHGPQDTTQGSGGGNSIPGWATPPKSPRSPFSSPKGSKREHRRSSGGGSSCHATNVSSAFNFDMDSHSEPTSPYGSPNRSRSTSHNNLLNTLEREAMHQDRFIPNRDSVDFDMAGHILHKADENKNGGNGEVATEGAPAGAKASKVSTSNSRTHLGVISNVNNAGTPNRLLGSGKGGRSKSKSSLDCAYLCDDGFSRLKEDKANNESTNEIATGAVAAYAAAAGINISGGASSLSPASRGKCRHIPTQPSRILDAPDLMDGDYLSKRQSGSSVHNQ